MIELHNDVTSPEVTISPSAQPCLEWHLRSSRSILFSFLSSCSSRHNHSREDFSLLLQNHQPCILNHLSFRSWPWHGGLGDLCCNDNSRSWRFRIARSSPSLPKSRTPHNCPFRNRVVFWDHTSRADFNVRPNVCVTAYRSEGLDAGGRVDVCTW